MDKVLASLRLGGEEKAAQWLRVSDAVYSLWPDRMHPIMTDRVYAAILRQQMAEALGLGPKQWFADPRNEFLLEGLVERVSIAAVTINLLIDVPAEFARTASGYGSPVEKAVRRRKRITRKNNSEDVAESVQ